MTQRTFAPALHPETKRRCYVDISIANPGPIFVAGDFDLPSPYQPMLDSEGHLTVPENLPSDGHVRCYDLSPTRLLGMWCPYSKEIEKAGEMIGVPQTVHFGWGGRTWCHAVRDWTECQ